MANLYGYVTNSKTGLPIYGAYVAITDPYYVSLTSADGYYIIEGLESGVYWMDVYKARYHSSYQAVSIGADDKMLNIALIPETSPFPWIPVAVIGAGVAVMLILLGQKRIAA